MRTEVGIGIETVQPVQTDSRIATHLPSILGRDAGGGAPSASVSGTKAAAPAPPPTQPSMGPSQSMPSEGRPPTFAFLTSTSSPFTSTTAPTVATTTREPSFTLPAFVTIGNGS